MPFPLPYVTDTAEPVSHSHIHGHKYQIVNRGDDYTSSNSTLNPPLKEGQANPIRRDTIQLLSMQTATLRFVADNPGSWLFHCHIDWHLSAVRPTFPVVHLLVV